MGLGLEPQLLHLTRDTAHLQLLHSSLHSLAEGPVAHRRSPRESAQQLRLALQPRDGRRKRAIVRSLQPGWVCVHSD